MRDFAGHSYNLLNMADVTIGAKLELDASGANQSVKSFKQQLKEAQNEVQVLSEKFGETSIQAQNAAKRAAELADKIGDAKKLVDAFNPDQKFRAFSQSLGGVLGGFSALTGAMGLLGVESEEVQKQLLKVQSALALSQGLNQLGESIASIKTLGSVLVQTLGKNGLIGLAIAGVALLGAALAGVFDGPSKKAKLLTDSIKELTKAETEARTEVYELKNAFKQAELGIISKEEALKKYNEGIGKTVGHAKDLNEAEKLTAENANAYITVQGLKAQANFILARSAELTAKAMIAEVELAKSAVKGAVGGDAAFNLIRTQLAQDKKDADDLLLLIDGINVKIAEASKTFKSTTAPGKSTGGKSTGTQADDLTTRISNQRIQTLADEQAAEEAIQKKREELTASHYERLTGLFKGFADNQVTTDIQRTENEKLLSIERTKQAEIERAAKVEAAFAVGGALGALADLIGKQTAAGKVLGIAQATINMFIGVSEVLRAKTILPEPFGTIAKIASVASIIAAGLSAIRNIAKVQVPGASGGVVPAVSAPVAQLPNATETTLNQNQLNQIGNATVRSFIVESDIANSRERITRLNRAARL